MTRPHLGTFRDLHLRKQRRLTAGQLHHRAPTLSPSGRLILHALSSGPESQWLCTDRKGRIARVLQGPVEGHATFAKDGSIAYGRQVGATCEIWLLSAGDAEPHRLLGGDGRLYRDPAFSHDGRFLAYLADDGGSAGPLRLWRYDVSRGSHELLLSSIPNLPGARLGHPVWAPWGDSLFFAAQQDGGSTIYELHLPSGQLSARSPLGYSSPAPIARGLLLACQHIDEQSQALVLLLHAPVVERARQLVLLDGKYGAAEPTLAIDKKHQVWVAYTQPGTIRSGEPQRSDLYLALLGKLPKGTVGTKKDSGAPSDDESDAEPDRRGRAVQARSTAAEDRPLPIGLDRFAELEHGA